MAIQRNIYLQDVELTVAQTRWREATSEFVAAHPSERIPVAESLGRVTARPVFAAVSAPFYHSSAMDGFAVRASDTFGASETSPKQLKLGTEAIAVDTGDPIPEGYDAVVMVEDSHPIGDEAIEIIAAAPPWQHVRPVGEDIVATELILPEHHVIRPADIGAMLAGGLTTVEVRRKPRLIVIPTGTELVPPGTHLKRGDIIEFNSAILGAMATEWGAAHETHPPVPDRYEALRDAIRAAVVRADVVVVNAGSSAGREDYTSHVLAELGEVIVHGVQIRPGKPVILAVVDGKPVLGIPGYPVSAMLTFELFARSLVLRLAGLPEVPVPALKARIAHKVASGLGAEEFLRVKLGRVGDRLIAAPISRGAGVITSMVRADGIVRIPSNSEGLLAGDEVDVELHVRPEQVEGTIVAIGSHDPALDVLGSHLKAAHPSISLSSAHVGSLGGLAALKRDECHLAGTHLLDEETGEYNVAYVRRVLAGRRVVLLTLMHRQQGLMVRKGNPKQITSFADLTRSDVSFVNRQRGSGTRLLLDHHLRQSGIDPDIVRGYEHDEYTHMAVAAAVESGAADVGLGALSAALALGLEFIPIAVERYDFAIPKEHFETEKVQRLLEVIRSASFQTAVKAMGGYDTAETGRIAAEL